MEWEDFRTWCSRQESKLWRCVYGDTLSGLIGIVLIYAALLFLILLIPTVSTLFRTLLFLIGVVVYVYVAFKIVKWLQPPLTTTETIACLLERISEQLTAYKSGSNNEELSRFLKYLHKIKIELDFPLESLFKNQIEMQKRFYSELKELPKRINHAVRYDNADKLDLNKLRALSKQIYDDSENKVETLHNIIGSYAMSEGFEWLNALVIKPWLNKKWFLMAVWIIILLLFTVVLHYVFGFGKDNLLLGFLSLIGVIAYIIYKK